MPGIVAVFVGAKANGFGVKYAYRRKTPHRSSHAVVLTGVVAVARYSDRGICSSRLSSTGEVECGD